MRNVSRLPGLTGEQPCITAFRRDCTPHKSPGQYLAFLGRISPEKRVDRAIEIAKRVGMPLKIAAKVDVTDQEYFQSKIKPLLDSPLVEYIGEIGEREKNEFLGNAFALLFPVDWSEPFGLVMIEATACGTPTIAFRMGSVPELLEQGRTGFIVDNLEQAVRAVDLVPAIDRTGCRKTFEKRFSARRMCLDYVKIYEMLIRENEEPEPTRDLSKHLVPWRNRILSQNHESDRHDYRG